jgi:hypothetical protein
MASITRPVSWFNWFYNEFGLASIQATGRNAYLIITARTMRMISFGGTQVMLGMLVLLPAIDYELTLSCQPCFSPSSSSPTFRLVSS